MGSENSYTFPAPDLEKLSSYLKSSSNTLGDPYLSSEVASWSETDRRDLASLMMSSWPGIDTEEVKRLSARLTQCRPDVNTRKPR